MKTILAIAMTMLLLALDWAALHDILKGEPDPYAEYIILLVSIMAFAVMAFIGVRGRGKKVGGHTP